MFLKKYIILKTLWLFGNYKKSTSTLFVHLLLGMRYLFITLVRSKQLKYILYHWYHAPVFLPAINHLAIPDRYWRWFNQPGTLYHIYWTSPKIKPLVTNILKIHQSTCWVSPIYGVKRGQKAILAYTSSCQLFNLLLLEAYTQPSTTQSIAFERVWDPWACFCCFFVE